MKLSSTQLEGFILLRDGLKMATDGINKIVESTEPKDTPQYDLKNIKTERTEGRNGFYDKAVTQDGQDYQNLIADLKAHEGKLTRDGFFCWLFDDGKTVGMKPSKR